MKTEDTEAETASKDKKIVDRSASYPSITIEEAISFTQSVSKSFPTPKQAINRDDIATVLGKKAPSIQRDVATAAQYGLFTKSKDGYVITELFKAINFPIDEKEKRKTLIEVFKSPKLYKDLIEKFDAHAVPTDLKPLLIRFHGIAEKAAQDASDIFTANARYCGVLSDSNVLNVNQTLVKLNDTRVQFAEVVTEDKPNDSGGGKVIEIKEEKKDNNLLPPHTDAANENVKIRLSEKKYAYLIYPDNINKTDIEIIKKEIEKLELIVN